MMPELPWLFCHGPIEAKVIDVPEALVTHFHDYFVMAPLKLPKSKRNNRFGRTSMTILSWPHWSPRDKALFSAKTTYFHDYFVMAPLKRVYRMPKMQKMQDFHDYFVMAPLKHRQ